MGVITDIFGTYNDYLLYFGDRHDREYVVILTDIDTSTSETLKYNPQGITKLGLNMKRSEVYKGILTSITLDLIFTQREYGGGTFLLDAYNSKGIRANVNCDIYKKNTSTNDYDLFYSGKVDFSPESFLHEPNKRVVSATLHEQGQLQKLLSRDEMKLDITRTTGVEGYGVIPPTPTTITFKGIILVWYARSVGGGFEDTDEAFNGSIETINTSTGRIDLSNPASDKIYVNTTSAIKNFEFSANDVWYQIDGTCTDPTDKIDIKVYLNVYSSGGGLLHTKTVLSYRNLGGNITLITDEGTQTFTNNNGGAAITSTTDGLNMDRDIAVNGYVRYFSDVVINEVNVANLDSFRFGNSGNTYEAVESSASIGNTTAACYSLRAVLEHLIRLTVAWDINWSLNTDKFDNIYITSGWKLRNIPNKGVTLSFMDIFKAANSIYPIALTFNVAENQFEVSEISDVYQNYNMADFGAVTNFEVKSSEIYYNRIICGSESKAEYEAVQGISEFNVHHEYSTSFEISNSLELRSPLSHDSMGMELTRRKQYTTTGLEDTKLDNTVFLVHCQSGATVQGGLNVSGVPKINQFYNVAINPAICLINHGAVIGGVFFRDAAGTAISFLSNSKDINITFDYPGATNRGLKSPITKAELGTPLFYPIEFNFETGATNYQLATIMANPHGYITFEDDDGNQYKAFVNSFETQDFEKTIKFSGIMANV